ncbi:MAG TPA: response regulator [Nitrospirales bacterium]|nr:response regulator [Nitrospirales bacterium]
MIRSMFSPGIALMDRLTYPKKFAMIGLLFAALLAIVLFFLIEEMNSGIEFATKELLGVEYLRPVQKLEEDLQDHRGLLYASNRDDAFDDKLARLYGQLDDDIRAVDSVDRKLGATLVTTLQWLEIKSKWRVLQSDAAHLPAQDSFDRHTVLIADVIALIAQAGDQSNLILDPDLDTYYLMETVVNRLPVLADQLGQARALGTHVVTQHQTVLAYDKFQISNLASLIKATQKSTGRNFDVAFHNTLNSRLQPLLEPVLKKSIGAISRMLNLLESITMGTKGPLPQPEDYWAVATEAKNANYQLYALASPALADLLHARIDKFSWKKSFVEIVTLVIVLVVLYLFMAFYLAVMRTVSSLDQVSRQLASDEIGETLLLVETRDELGQITRAFSTLVRRLRQEWATSQEETARATVAEARASLIIGTALDAVIVMDGKGKICDWNPMAETIFGWPRDEAIGRLLSETIVPLQHREAHEQGLKRFLATGEGPVLNKRIEITAYHRDGHEFPVELAISPVQSGDTFTFSAFVRDITERKQAEKNLSVAKEAAEAANVAKSEFLASMSHEIRTPMNAIIGMADLLAETPLSVEQTKYVQIFRRAGDNLLDLINDILDLSKVEASQLGLERTGFDLNELVEKVTEMLSVRAHAKFLELAGSIAPEVPPYLVGDPTRLRQVLLNLLGNAIKFTDSGEVALRVEVDKSRGEDQGGSKSVALRFAISDTGIGIPPDKLGTIFERFTQVDSSTTRKHGGTGLGLAICKRLVELMGGRIWVESSPGSGTTFYFTVCVEVQSATQRSSKFTPVQLRGLRTLVVDDNDTNRLILRELLSSWKAVVTETATGKDALAELQRAQAAATPYELVLLDCRMPEMDGFQVAEAIREHPGLTGVTMMMLTSENRKEHIQRARDLDLAGYVVKPIRRTDLLEAVATAVGQSRSAAAPARAEAPPQAELAPRPLRILLAEDSADNRLLIQSFFKKTPHHLDIADNGTIAVAKFRARSYDLVLMDMQMPVKDGYAATRAIRQWERDHGRPPTPIIALTAHALKEDEEKCLAAGCTTYLTKPIKKATLLQAIQEYGMMVST